MDAAQHCPHLSPSLVVIGWVGGTPECPISYAGIFEYTRQCAEAIRDAKPSPPQLEYAIGCVEWQRQREQVRG